MSSVDVAAESYGGEYPGNIFDWMRVLLVALARKDLKPEVVALAGFIAFSGEHTAARELARSARQFALTSPIQ